MTDFIFGLLESVGFTHPVHPAVTHLPMGMVMGAFFFGLAGLVLKKPEFFKTANHCVGLGLIFIPPTVIAGILDWQHTYSGNWETLIIIKMVLATLLTCLMAVGFLLGRREDTDPKMVMVFYVLCLVCAVGLGFSGGELQYG